MDTDQRDHQCAPGRHAVIVCLAGHPSVDRLYEVDLLRPGEIHRPGVALVLPGGKGLNVARAIRRLGGEPHTLAILAGHQGRWIEDALRSERIDGTFVWTSGETRTSVSVAMTSAPGATMTEFYEGSPPISPEVWAELEGAARHLLPDAELLCMSGSLIPGAPTEGYRRAIKLAHEAGIPVALDSHGPQLTEALNGCPELLKVNVREAAEALGTSAPTNEVLAWATSAAAELRERAGKHTTCVLTCGPEGMVLVDRDGVAYRGHLRQVGSYPVGSGDAALGALAVAYVGGVAPAQALAAALGAGAANAEVPGPGILDRELASTFATQASVERFGLP